ncbi:MAG: DNA-methyltransferase [Nodosilinea sp.]
MKGRSPRNRTLDLSGAERELFSQRLMRLNQPVQPAQILNQTICQDLWEVMPYLPSAFVDLMILDPPYNLNKSFNGRVFNKLEDDAYTAWLNSWLGQLKKVLKPNASIYCCGDWSTSVAMYPALREHFKIRNRITWEREKGRGAKANWKNTCEDIWFCTVSDNYYFNVDAVKLKRRVIAPYVTPEGHPKDWEKQGEGKYRLTHPANLWTDITIPFWSMAENTDHPTQKSEKLLAKLILASSEPADVVFDPFLGSGTTAVVAKKLGRQFVGIEIEPNYCCLAQKRLDLAAVDNRIQGYREGIFWERNTLPFG